MKSEVYGYFETLRYLGKLYRAKKKIVVLKLFVFSASD